MRRRSSVELEVNHDRWLVSYSDFVTLLFAFFVVMYSISQVNEGKYRVLSSTLMDAFSVPQSAISPIQVGSPTLSVAPTSIEVSEPQSPDEASQSDSDQSLADLDDLASKFADQFSDLIDDDLLSIKGNELWLELELKDSILFPVASASPSLQAKGIFEEIAEMLANFDNPIQVEGFTDDVPINNRRFSSNWELSAARSASVVKILAGNEVAPERLSAVGYGEFQPVASNSSADGRAQNRRVVLMIARDRSDRPRLQDETAVEEAIGDREIVDLSSDSDPAVDVLENEAPENEVEEDQAPLINPVRLPDGGLLFTNDPDLRSPAVETAVEGVQPGEIQE